MRDKLWRFLAAAVGCKTAENGFEATGLTPLKLPCRYHRGKGPVFMGGIAGEPAPAFLQSIVKRTGFFDIEDV